MHSIECQEHVIFSKYLPGEDNFSRPENFLEVRGKDEQDYEKVFLIELQQKKNPDCSFKFMQKMVVRSFKWNKIET